MSSSDSHIPSGWPAVVPRLSVDQPDKMVQFLKEVFGAKGEHKEDRPSELRIGDSLIMIGGTLERMPTMSFLYVYVEDVDKAYDKAISLGANSIETPEEMPYGDRRAMIRDPWGNYWQIATHRRFAGDA
jgi:PhnB protein